MPFCWSSQRHVTFGLCFKITCWRTALLLNFTCCTEDSTLKKHYTAISEVRKWKHVSDTWQENSLVFFKSPTSRCAMSNIRKALRDQSTGWTLGSYRTPRCFGGGWERGRNHVLHVVTLTASIKGQLCAHWEKKKKKRSGCVTGNHRTKKGTCDAWFSIRLSRTISSISMYLCSDLHISHLTEETKVTTELEISNKDPLINKILPHEISLYFTYS